MSQIIAGIYEIQEKIGAGGGGVVYLGRHTRLDKKVVLKADKRTLSTGTEALRREVDMLKNLSHTYIPQVYDFVQENGTVYTVMDFIEGESLDKLLGRKQIPSQPQTIRWACQLLEALSYLHSRPPHGILHGDIKPANIMQRPNGDICLIDFNIALALGEDGAVKVGFSRGYASPEHYGADYISENRPAAVAQLSKLATTVTNGKNAGKAGTRGGAEGISDRTEIDDGSDRTETEDSSDRTETEDSSDRTEADDNTIDTPEAAHSSGNRPQESISGAASHRAADPDSLSRSAAGKSAAGSTAGKKGGILLDVRSDIYSLGATLYHLISGRRPAQRAEEVVPLGPDVCSPGVSAILQKAMAPDPAQRYQTAEEMRLAFLELPRKDIKTVRHRRRMAVSAAALTAMFLTGGVAAFLGLKQLEQRQAALTMAEYSANTLAEGNVAGAVEQALQAIPDKKTILDAPVTAQARMALTNALGVYDLSDGFHALGTVELPSAPFGIAVSPGGTRFAAVYAYEAAVYDMADQRKIAVLPTQTSALSDLVFVDESRIVYAGDRGVTAYDLDTGSVLWTGAAATTLALSGDRATVAAVDRDADHAILYRIADGTKAAERTFEGAHLPVAANDIFADPEDYIFALNRDGSLLALSTHKGGLILYDWEDPAEDLVIYEESEYTHFEGGFHGRYFAFSAGKGGEALFRIVDTVDAVFAGGFDSSDPIQVRADEDRICVADGNLLIELEPNKGNGGTYSIDQQELAYTDTVQITGFAAGPEYVLTVTDDNCFSFYDSGANLSFTESGSEKYDFTALTGDYAVLGNRNEPMLRLLKLERHEDAALLSYDARYDHDEARVSRNGETAMLFKYQDFRIYDMTGRIAAEGQFPDPEHIYDQQFHKGEEGSWLEVIWYDGARRRYSAADGSLLSEETGEAPDKELYEEFFTDKYRFASSLHTAPEAYDKDSGKLVATLEKDSYLTYVTQAGDYIITEYISSEGERYGILLNDKLEKLAYLPGLCDVAGDRLIFDYRSGNLRQSKIYSLEELVGIGKDMVEKD